MPSFLLVFFLPSSFLFFFFYFCQYFMMMIQFRVLDWGDTLCYWLFFSHQYYINMYFSFWVSCVLKASTIRTITILFQFSNMYQGENLGLYPHYILYVIPSHWILKVGGWVRSRKKILFCFEWSILFLN